MSKYDTVIFDLDGTLLNTIEDLAASVCYALSNNGMPERTVDEVRSFVGNGIGKLMERAVPSGTDGNIIEKALGDFREHYRVHCMDLTHPYTGIREMLEEMKRCGFKTAIVSNKADFAVKELWKYYFPDLIGTAVGERVGVPRKPAPDSVFAAAKELGSALSGTIYAGDSDVDILTAKNAGIPCISVSWGFKGRKFLEEHGAEYIIDKPCEIFDIIG